MNNYVSRYSYERFIEGFTSNLFVDEFDEYFEVIYKLYKKRKNGLMQGMFLSDFLNSCSVGADMSLTGGVERALIFQDFAKDSK